MAKVNISGKMVEEKDACISVFDHGLLYGDGVFEGIRVYGRCIFKLDEHVERMYDSARAISLPMPVDRQKFKEEIIRTCKENGIESGYIRAVATRGAGDLGLNPRTCKNPQYIIIARKVDPLLGEKSIEQGADIITSSIRRVQSCAIPIRAKTLNYLNSVLAAAQAIDMGKDEAIMFSESGYVAEGSGDNIFIIKNGVIKTPPESSGALKGITRDSIIEMARANGFFVEEADMTHFDIYTADEIFLTGTLAEIVPVKSIDSRKVGDGRPGETTKKLAALFRKYVANKGHKY
ncbi:MAG: branched-chain-amino-acid transaminase [Candidatus Micrarchaeia archaeon]